MKKILLLIMVLLSSFCCLSQACEERETKMLSVMGSFSAGFLYNTYALIGSISDGFANDGYSEETTTNLINAQIKLADNMTGLMEKILYGNPFKDEKDKNYLASCVAIIKGLKTQSQRLLDVVNNNNQKHRTAYEEQRKKNWKDLSQLMGVPE